MSVRRKVAGTGSADSEDGGTWGRLTQAATEASSADMKGAEAQGYAPPGSKPGQVLSNFKPEQARRS